MKVVLFLTNSAFVILVLYRLNLVRSDNDVVLYHLALKLVAPSRRFRSERRKFKSINFLKRN